MREPTLWMRPPNLWKIKVDSLHMTLWLVPSKRSSRQEGVALVLMIGARNLVWSLPGPHPYQIPKIEYVTKNRIIKYLLQNFTINLKTGQGKTRRCCRLCTLLRPTSTFSAERYILGHNQRSRIYILRFSNSDIANKRYK
jgi:hypothetical protein